MIPNVALGDAEVEVLRAFEGRLVELIAGSDGSVVIQPAGESQVPTLQGARSDSLSLTVPLPDLTVRRPLPLDQVSRSLSGRVVGPKAANLGELNRLFPGRVAPAIALPFGVFADHVGQGANAPLARLAGVYAARRRGEIDAQQLADALAVQREEIASIVLGDELRVAAFTGTPSTRNQ